MTNDYIDLLTPPAWTKSNIARETEQRGGYALQDNEDIRTIDLPHALYVTQNRIFFGLDPLDTTSIHDGVTVLVSQDGKRFKSSVFPRQHAVLDRLATPPGSPAPGDLYLIIAAATGAWAGLEDDLALWTLNGWAFITPVPGMIVYVNDETGFYHYNAAGAWAAGFGSFTITDGTLHNAALLFAAGIAVEAEQNSPPGTPVDNKNYIVGGTPTGDWVGQNQKIAMRRSGQWVYVAPYQGATVYDLNLSKPRSYIASAWVDSSTASIHVASFSDNDAAGGTTANNSWVSAVAAAYTGTGPDNTEGSEVASVSHELSNAGNKIEFEFQAYVRTNSTGIDGTFIAIYVDSETTPRDFVLELNTNDAANAPHTIRARFEIAVGDISSHDYKIRIGNFDSITNQPLDYKRLLFNGKEIIP